MSTPANCNSWLRWIGVGLIVTLLAIAATGCTKKGGGEKSTSSQLPEAGIQKTVTGILLDGRGNPVPGADFYFTNKTTNKQTIVVSATDGSVESKLDDGAYALVIKFTGLEVYQGSFKFGPAMKLDLGIFQGTAAFLPWYVDNDADTYGDWHTATVSATRPVGYAVAFNDCDDNNSNINPKTTWYLDNDSDKYPGAESSIQQCQQPSESHIAGYTIIAFDCDDNNAAVNPGKTEIFHNNVDDDCNSVTLDEPEFKIAAVQGKWRYRKLHVGAVAGKPNHTYYGDYNFSDQGGIKNVFVTRSDGQTITSDKSNHVEMDERGNLQFPATETLLTSMSFTEDLMVGVGSEPDVGHTFYAFVRSPPALTLHDVVGKWMRFGLSAGSFGGHSFRYTGSFDIDDFGWNSYTRQTTLSPIEEHGTLWMQAYARNASITSNMLTNGFAWTVSADKNLLVGTVTDVVAGLKNDTIELVLRTGGVYNSEDLVGQWTFYSLSVGTANNQIKWTRGALTVATDGSTTLDYQIDDGVSRYPFDTMAISDSGSISSSGISDWIGQLSADKTKFLASFNTDNNAQTLLVALRRRMPTMNVSRQVGNAAIATLDTNGGVLKATANDGKQYELTLPPGALKDGVTKEIRVVPIGKFNTFFRAGNIPAAVHLVPDGLILQKPATLLITMPDGVPASYSGFQYQGYGGDDVDFILGRTLDATTIETNILHFSGVGISDAGPNQQPLPTEVYLEIIRNEMERQAAETGTAVMTPDLEALADQWLKQITGDINNAPDSPALRKAFQNFLKWYEAMNWLEDVPCNLLPDTLTQFTDSLKNKIDSIVVGLNETCKQSNDVCQRRSLAIEIINWVALHQSVLSTISCLENTGVNIPQGADICNNWIENDPSSLAILPKAVTLQPGKSVDLNIVPYNFNGAQVDYTSDLNWTTNSSAFSVSGNKVTGNKPGSGSATATMTNAQCLNEGIYVDVIPDLTGIKFRLDVLKELHIKDTPKCRNLNPKPATSYEVEFPIFSTDTVKMTSNYLNESGYGSLFGGNFEVSTSKDNPWEVLFPIGTKYYFFELRGTREWSWLGLYDPQTGYTGCAGSDSIMLTPLE